MSLETETRPRRRLWLRILLGASLALNLLVFGLLAGAAMRFDGPDRKPPHPSVGAALFREMPRADRSELFQSMRGDRDREMARQAEEAKAVLDTLRATPFDPDALSSVVGRHLNRRSTKLAATQDDWLSRVAQMDAGARAEYADRIENALSGKGQKRKWWHKR